MTSLILVRALAIAADELGVSLQGPGREVWSESALDDPADAIPRATFQALLLNAADRLENAPAGAHLAARLDSRHLHCLGLLWASSATLHQAVERFFKLRRLVLGGPAWSIEDNGATLLLGYAMDDASRATVIEAQFLTMIILRLVTELLGQDRGCRLEVCFSFSEQWGGKALRDCFPCKVWFNQPRNGVTLPSAVLHERRAGGDEGLAHEVERALYERFVMRATSCWTDRVRQMLSIAEGPGHVELDALASYWCMSGRSMRRRLEAEGATFKDLREQVCMSLASEWLLQRAYPSSEIARLLGRDVSSFRRAFKRHFGVSPMTYRSRCLPLGSCDAEEVSE